jgi:hypothetical protein
MTAKEHGTYPDQSTWKKGPLPPDTYGWGGVVPTDMDKRIEGFYFADFDGNKVYVEDGKDGDKRRVLSPDEVAYYNNSLSLPPKRS